MCDGSVAWEEKHNEHFHKTKCHFSQYHKFRDVELSLSVQYPKEFTGMWFALTI